MLKKIPDGNYRNHISIPNLPKNPSYSFNYLYFQLLDKNCSRIWRAIIFALLVYCLLSAAGDVCGPFQYVWNAIVFMWLGCILCLIIIIIIRFLTTSWSLIDLHHIRNTSYNWEMQSIHIISLRLHHSSSLFNLPKSSTLCWIWDCVHPKAETA